MIVPLRWMVGVGGTGVGVRVGVGVDVAVGVKGVGVLLGAWISSEVTGVELLLARRPIRRELMKRSRARENPLICLGTKVFLQQRRDIHLAVPVEDGEEILSGA